MKLAAYLSETGTKRIDFAAAIEVSPAYVTALCAGEYWPSKSVVERIRAATGGRVTADDFMSAPEAAAE